MAAVGCYAFSLLATPERFGEALREVCERGPGRSVCQGGTTETTAALIRQGKLGNLCL